MTLTDAEREFHWRDGERWIEFGPDAAAAAATLLAERGWDGYELLSTERALAGAPGGLVAGASAVHDVAAGQVPDLAAALIEAVGEAPLVALGGGRVIDVAKAIGAVSGLKVAAIPTTLSGAELTTIHRLPEGRSAPALIRPAVVIADSSLMTSAGEPSLRASAMNALAHGAEPLYTPYANPVATASALRGAELIAKALDSESIDRAALALGAILCAFALDSAGFAVHHVVCQTLVRTLEIPHAPTYAAVLPRSLELVRERAPEPIAALAAAIGTESAGIGPRIERLAGGARRLGDLGGDKARLEDALDAMLARGELANTPSPPGRDELRELVLAAW